MATIVITGANRGIGRALAELLAKRGDVVIGTSRKAAPKLKGLGVEVHEGVEVADDRAVASFAKALGTRTVDVLVNNAGIYASDRLDTLDFGTLRQEFEVNALGPIRVTRALLPLMTKGGKVAIITSRSGSIGDNGSGGMYGYRMSKAAVNMAGVNMALELKPKGISVALLHPGMVNTDMGSGGGIEPHVSAGRLIARIDEMTMDNTGRFLHAEGYELPW
jgi:NAD(P)-dependent dehydrogenase (short-subunit alcohol dehydrogenase family)